MFEHRCRARPARTRLTAAGAIAAAAIVAISTAQAGPHQIAQSGPPVPLGPPTSLDPSKKPPVGKPKEDDAKGGIRVESLGAPNAEAIGVLGPEEGGFGPRLWRGANRTIVFNMIARLPTQSRSPALRDLARRLLLTRANPPRGLVLGRSLVSVRLERLHAMGAIEGATAFAKVIPTTVTGARLGELQADLLFAANDVKAACEVVTRNLTAYDTPALQQRNVACLALGGDAPRTTLALGVLREAAAIPDESWELLVEALAQAEKTIKVESLKNATAMHLALLRAAKAELPADIAETNDPVVLRALALDESVPEAIRLVAGEAAARRAVIGPKALAKVWEGQSFEKTDVARARTLAGERFDAQARARLYVAAKAAEQPVARLRILNVLWSLSRKQWDYRLAARASAPLLADVAPEPALREFAPAVIRALLHAGEGQLAAGWYKLVETGTDTEAASRLWPVMRLAAPDTVVFDAARLAEWRALMKRRAPDEAERRDAIFRTLLEMVGDDAYATIATPTTGKGARVSTVTPRLWRGMRSAADLKRVGETLLGVLVGIENGDFSELDAVDLRLVLGSLRDVGLIAELRDLAIDAALANKL